MRQEDYQIPASSSVIKPRRAKFVVDAAGNIGLWLDSLYWDSDDIDELLAAAASYLKLKSEGWRSKSSWENGSNVIERA